MRGYARENASVALISRRQRPAFCGGENGLSARMHDWDGWRIIAGGKTACDTLWFNENSGSQAECGIVEWFRSRMLMATAVSGTRSDVSDAIKHSSRITRTVKSAIQNSR